MANWIQNVRSSLARTSPRTPAGRRLYRSVNRFADFVVGDAEHGDVGDLGVKDQAVLHLLGIDVDTPGDDHERLERFND